MIDKQSFYEGWLNRFPFRKMIDEIIYDNFLEAKANADNTLITKFLTNFFYSKRYYYIHRLNRKIGNIAKELKVSTEVIKTHLLFEVKKLSLHCDDLAPINEDPRFNRYKTRLKDLSIVQYFKNLEVISFYGQDIFDLAELLNFSSLRELTIQADFSHYTYATELKNLQSINKLPNLLYLNLNGNSISDFSIISNPSVRYLELRETNLEFIADLKELKNLRFLDIYGTNVTNLEGIDSFEELEVLCFGKSEIVDFSGLSRLPKLKLIVYSEFGDERRRFVKNELMKVNSSERNISIKDEYNFGLGFQKDLLANLELGFQKRASELIR